MVIQSYNGALTFLDSKGGGGSGSYASNTNETAKGGGAAESQKSESDFSAELDDEIPF